MPIGEGVGEIVVAAAADEQVLVELRDRQARRDQRSVHLCVSSVGRTRSMTDSGLSVSGSAMLASSPEESATSELGGPQMLEAHEGAGMFEGQRPPGIMSGIRGVRLRYGLQEIVAAS